MRKSGTQPSTSTLRIDAQKKDKNGQTRLQFTKVSGGGERQTTTQSSARKSRFIVADEPFSVDNEQLTPSMKIRRHVIGAKYGERLAALYAAPKR